MTIDEICDLPVGEIADKESHLWLWITWPKIREGVAHRVLEAWGFEWKSELIWDKDRFGIGWWLKKQTEVCIVANKGGLQLATNTSRDLLRVRRGEHSRKPHHVYELIEKESPAPRVELFARTQGELFLRTGWHFWGNQA